MVTGVVLSPPRYVPPFLSRIGFSIPTTGSWLGRPQLVAHPRDDSKEKKQKQTTLAARGDTRRSASLYLTGALFVARPMGFY